MQSIENVPYTRTGAIGYNPPMPPSIVITEVSNGYIVASYGISYVFKTLFQVSKWLRQEALFKKERETAYEANKEI